MGTGFYDRLKSAVLAASASAIVLAFLGPFGTYSEMSFGLRLVYFGLLCNGIGLCMMVCVSIATGASAHPWYSMIPRTLLGNAIGAVPGLGLVLAMYGWMREPALDLGLARLAQMWGQVTLLGTIITLAELWRTGYILPSPKTQDSPPAKGSSRDPNIAPTQLHAQLAPEHARSEIVSMSMQDHYVEVTTTRGTEMVLMRFSDAIKDVAPVDGLRVHRSHWVATAHIDDLQRSGHKAQITLRDGRQLPVSQTYLEQVKERMNHRTAQPQTEDA